MESEGNDRSRSLGQPAGPNSARAQQEDSRLIRRYKEVPAAIPEDIRGYFAIIIESTDQLSRMTNQWMNTFLVVGGGMLIAFAMLWKFFAMSELQTAEFVAIVSVGAAILLVGALLRFYGLRVAGKAQREQRDIAYELAKANAVPRAMTTGLGDGSEESQ